MFFYLHPPRAEQNAMCMNSRFTQKFADDIVSVLGCFDRVIFKGYLPFGNDAHLNAFVDYRLRIRRMDFLPMIEPLSQSLVDHAKSLAADAEVPYVYFDHYRRKEDVIRKMLLEHPVQEGLVAVLCFKETC